MIRLAIRGFAAGKKVFEDRLLLDASHLDAVVSDAANKHAEDLLEHRLHMIEIEFLDEPNPLERFFRFGSDPQLMRRPLMADLTKANS